MHDNVLILAFDCGAVGIFLIKWAIPHKHAGPRVLGGPPSEVGDVVGYYHEAVVYSDLCGQK